MANLRLRPIHYASISGGKDSFAMLMLILKNPQKYPLDLVVHFELEIDWDWSKKVVDMLEERCKKAGIKFLRIKPRKSFEELYEKYDIPTRRCRWCNSEYKLDCKKQLNEWIAEQNCRPVAYIGFCADEQKRFKYDIGDWAEQDCCYPLAEEGITEDVIWRWAKNNPIFHDYYRIFKRQGCRWCPNHTRLELAYLYKYYNAEYTEWINRIRKYENKFHTTWETNTSINEIDTLIKTKWQVILFNAENYEQMTIFDYAV